MVDKNSLINLLESHSMSYKITEHKPLFTVEDSKNLLGSIDGAHSKNLFLKDKKNNFFLVSFIAVSYTHLTLPTSYAV